MALFTGIIEEIGIVEKIQKEKDGATLFIGAKKILEDIKIGDSIAVNGVCLTVTSFWESGFCANVMHETLKRSSFSKLSCNHLVNLERAMAADGRFGGHFVAGHIDGVGEITRIAKDGIAIWYTVKAAPEIMRYIVQKGSIAIDGISLTVAKLERDSFLVSTIPHTIQMTTLAKRKVGDIVNLENDIVGKYVERLLGKEESEKKQRGITEEFLIKCGY